MQWFSRFRRQPAHPMHQVRHQPYGAIAFPGTGGNPYGQTLEGLVGGLRHPGSSTNWAEEVRDITLNYAVAGCLRWIADNIPEPAAQVVDKQPDGKVKPRPTHPLIDLLLDPNEDYDGDSLLSAAAWDYAITGRAYWIKERDNLGRVRQLWWAPWWTMAPRWPTDGSQFITDYIYRPDGTGKGVVYRKEDVVHFRWGLDALTGGRLGVHRTRPFLPAIAATNEGMIYTPSILRNMGIVPNVLVVNGKVGEETRKNLREWFKSLFTGDGRGSPGVLEVQNGGASGSGSGISDLKQLGLSPEDLTLDTILDRPEIIICSAGFGIHPGVFFLGGAGGKGFDNGGQLEQARKGSYHDCLMPMLKRFGKTISRRLLPDFEEVKPSQTYCRYDFSDVEALQEDQTELHKRNDDSVKAGWMRVSEAREKGRLPVSPGDNVYLRQSGVTAVTEADENPQPAVELPGVNQDPDEPEEEDEDEAE